MWRQRGQRALSCRICAWLLVRLLLASDSWALSVDPTPKYLLPATVAGLTNQRWCVLKSLVLAKVHRFQFVLPTWEIDHFEGGTADILPFDYFYNSSKLAEFAKPHNVTIVDALPTQLYPACLVQLSNKLFSPQCPTPYEKTILAWARKHKVVCLSGWCAFKQMLEGMSLEDTLDVFRPALHPSKLFQAEVDAVMAALQRTHNTTTFVTVHVRTEANFKDACDGGRLGAPGFVCYVNEAAIEAYMRTKVEQGTLVFIASEDPVSSMPTLCKRYRCWKTEELKPDLGPGIIDKLTSRAFIDFLLARRGSRFFGNRFSTFSVELAHEFRRCHLGAADFYNKHIAGI